MFKGPCCLLIHEALSVSLPKASAFCHDCEPLSCSIESMQPGAIIVNVSRGGLVDVDAAMDALESGQLGGLAMDVYEQEGEQSHGPERRGYTHRVPSGRCDVQVVHL